MLKSVPCVCTRSDDIEGDQRLPHNSGEDVPFSELERLGLLPRPNIGMDEVERM